MNPSKALFSPALTANLSKTACRGLASSTSTTYGLRSSAIFRPIAISASREFSTSRRSQLDYFQPPRNLPNIKLTPPAWAHPAATEQQLKDVDIAHRDPRNFSDRAALRSVKFLRWATDLVTGYRHDPNKPYVMSERKWLIRFIFLETVAGVPGMMAGMLRHFHSLRRMKRDNGW